MSEGEREREGVCVCVCACARESECVSENGRERETSFAPSARHHCRDVYTYIRIRTHTYTHIRIYVLRDLFRPVGTPPLQTHSDRNENEDDWGGGGEQIDGLNQLQQKVCRCLNGRK